eukprot:4860846-Lingulodinium_polyedra.AAC.1
MGYALSPNPDNASMSIPAAAHISVQLRRASPDQGAPKMSASTELSTRSRGNIEKGLFDAPPVE